jgi:hypothetical protein
MALLLRCLPLLLFSASLYADDSPLNLRWRDLIQGVAGKDAIVNLKDGSQVKTTVTSVQPAALAVLVTSDDHPTYKKGEVSIPRDSVAGLRIIAHKKKHRVMGTAIGGAIGAAAAGTIIYRNTFCCGGGSSGGDYVATGLAVGLPVAGYFWGLRRDRVEVPINILAD